jgi:hypothetical protein
MVSLIFLSVRILNSFHYVIEIIDVVVVVFCSRRISRFANAINFMSLISLMFVSVRVSHGNLAALGKMRATGLHH